MSERDLRGALGCEEMGGRRNQVLFYFLIFSKKHYVA